MEYGQQEGDFLFGTMLWCIFSFGIVLVTQHMHCLPGAGRELPTTRTTLHIYEAISVLNYLSYSADFAMAHGHLLDHM